MENKNKKQKEFIIPIKKDDNKKEVLNIEMNINLNDPEEFNKNISQLKDLLSKANLK